MAAVLVAVIAGILIATWVVGQGDGNGNSAVDAFPAQRAWLYVPNRLGRG
jgi:hypothetical protein